MQPSSKKSYSKDLPYLGVSLFLLLVALLRLGVFTPNRKVENPQQSGRAPAQLLTEAKQIEPIKGKIGHRVLQLNCEKNALHLSILGEKGKLTQIRILPCAQMRDVQLTRKNTDEKFLLLSKKNILYTPIFSAGEEQEVFEIEWKDRKTKKILSTTVKWKKDQT